MWLKNLLTEIGVKVQMPMEILSENQAAIHISSNPVLNERTKHIEADCHFIREKADRKEIVTPYAQSLNQPADIFTKALGRPKMLTPCSKLGMLEIYAPACWGV